jgi:hypothetical protein
MIPPEVIVLNRIEDPPFPFVVNHRRNFCFFLAFVKKPVHSHHPSEEEPMFFNSLNAVRRTSGKAGASVTVEGRDVISVKIHQPESGIETSRLIGRGGRLSKGLAVGAQDQKPKNQKG